MVSYSDTQAVVMVKRIACQLHSIPMLFVVMAALINAIKELTMMTNNTPLNRIIHITRMARIKAAGVLRHFTSYSIFSVLKSQLVVFFLIDDVLNIRKILDDIP